MSHISKTSFPIDLPLYEAAKSLIELRFPEGPGGASALYTTSGYLLTGVGLKTPNAPANLCRETGAILEAVKLGEPISAIICLVRNIELRTYEILPPCGICQERLWAWGGGEISVACPPVAPHTKWSAFPLRRLQPHYWAQHANAGTVRSAPPNTYSSPPTY